MKDKFKIIFIVGVGRSGTSMLQAILNAHSSISFPPETHFIKNYLKKGLQINNYKKEILNDQYLKHLELDLNKITTNSIDVLDFYKNMMIEYLSKKSKVFIGDKDPKNIENLKLIKNYFPHALLIHIYRDPRDVISSRRKAHWSKDNSLWKHILAYKAQFNYMKQNQNLFSENFVEVKYEDLIQNPKIELEKILKKLNLKYEKNMLTFYKKANEIVKGKEIDWKKNLYKPIIMNNANKWKYELEENTITMIEKCLFNEMKSCGYECFSKSKTLATIFSVMSKIYNFKNCY